MQTNLNPELNETLSGFKARIDLHIEIMQAELDRLKTLSNAVGHLHAEGDVERPKDELETNIGRIALKFGKNHQDRVA